MRTELNKKSKDIQTIVGTKVIVTTCRENAYFGELVEKVGSGVLLKNGRMFLGWDDIRINNIALYGPTPDFKIAGVSEAIPVIWLKAIEIIQCSPTAIKSLEEMESYEREKND